jgi:ketosteroid isomerase-like protein
MSAAHLRPEEALELVMRHAECELRCDWDGALATMTDNPYYLYYPLGLRIRGREAIKEHWQRLLSTPGLGASAISAKLKNWVLDDSVVTMSEWLVDVADGHVRSRTYALFRFADGLIESESIYADGDTEDLMASALSGDFLSRQGVQRLYEVA